MKIVILSNFFNHHQKPLSDALNRATESQFRFIATKCMDAERKAMGWNIAEMPTYVLDANKSSMNEAEATDWIEKADLVLWGDAPRKYVKKRLKKKKMTVRCTERIFKKGFSAREFWPRAVLHWWLNRDCKGQYLFAMSAYAARDYERIGRFRNGAYRWGYFTETKRYDLSELFQKKKKQNPPIILWAGRLIGWKHPEAAVFVAEKLKENGYEFEMNIIGRGDLYVELQEEIEEKGLKNCVHLLGAMPPEEVRKYMEEARIFLFTSDQNEGWGAVLNESMNSGCAVVANQSIGAVPWLIRQGKNGFIYSDGDWDELYKYTRCLLEDKTIAQNMGKAAYQTIVTEWNAENAAARLLEWYADKQCGCETEKSWKGILEKE